MTKTQVEVVTSAPALLADGEGALADSIELGRRRRRSPVAAGIATRQLIRWRRQLCGPAAPAFTVVAVVPGPEKPGSATPTRSTTIEEEFVTGGRMRISGLVGSFAVSRLIKTLTPANGGYDPDRVQGSGVAGAGHAECARVRWPGGAGAAALKRPHGGHLFAFRGRRCGLIKVRWHDGQAVPLLQMA